MGRSELVSQPASQRVGESAGVTRTGSALLTAIAVLAVAHWWPQRDVRGLAPAVMADAWRMHWPKRPVPVTPALQPLNGVQETGAQGAPGTLGKNPQAGLLAVNGGPTQGGQGGAISPVMVDDAHALDPFFVQLWALQQG